jgi:hypothetical protein
MGGYVHLRCIAIINPEWTAVFCRHEGCSRLSNSRFRNCRRSFIHDHCVSQVVKRVVKGAIGDMSKALQASATLRQRSRSRSRTVMKEPPRSYSDGAQPPDDAPAPVEVAKPELFSLSSDHHGIDSSTRITWMPNFVIPADPLEEAPTEVHNYHY